MGAQSLSTSEKSLPMRTLDQLNEKIDENDSVRYHFREIFLDIVKFRSRFAERGICQMEWNETFKLFITTRRRWIILIYFNLPFFRLLESIFFWWRHRLLSIHSGTRVIQEKWWRKKLFIIDQYEKLGEINMKRREDSCRQHFEAIYSFTVY